MDNRGIALLITMLLLGTIIATALGVAVVVTGQTGMARLVDDSILAIFAADAGLEKILYACSGKIASPSPASFFKADIGNGAGYEVHMQNNSCDDNSATSKGTYGSAARSVYLSY